MVAHRKEIGEPPGDNVNRETLLTYYNQSPLYKLDDEEKWPLNETLNDAALTFFLKREGKCSQVMEADTFFTLRKHPEWQAECGINLPPQDLAVFTLKREQNKAQEKLKPCCSACRTRQKTRLMRGEGEIEDCVSPQGVELKMMCLQLPSW